MNSYHCKERGTQLSIAPLKTQKGKVEKFSSSIKTEGSRLSAIY